MWRACEKNIGDTIPKRQGNNKKKADIDDIVKALRKLQSANMMPLVLSNGKMLMRTPMSAGIARNHENNDISNRVSLLENSLNSFMKQQSDQIKELQSLCRASVGPPPSNIRPPIFRNIRSANDYSASPNKRKREDTDVVVLPPAQEQAHPSFVQVASQNLPGIRQIGASQPPQPPRRSSTVMYGTSKVGKDENEELLAADVALVAFGVSKEASADQLSEFVKGKGINVVNIEKLTRDEVDSRTNTFKVIIKLEDYEKAMKPDIWPYRVGIRHYWPPRRQQGLSWEQQTNGHSRQSRQNQYLHPNYQQRQQQPFSIELKNRYQALADNPVDVFPATPCVFHTPN